MGIFQSARGRWAMGLLLLVYLAHFYFCARTALPEFTQAFPNSDMHANWQWARQILEQGWLNPRPYHPYNDWMQEIAPYEIWCQWWGTPSIYQQSPLFAYLLAAFLVFCPNLLVFHVFQCVATWGLCVLLSLIASRYFQSQRAGWIAFILAGLYAPFYAYAWPLLRDLLGWIVLALALLVLRLWQEESAGSPRKYVLALSAGAILGIGLLARETFYLIIPLVLLVVAVQGMIQRHWKSLGSILLGLGLTLSPLVIRNVWVGAPAFSSSNRFVENFIEGNAASARPAAFFIPPEMGSILHQSGGKMLAAVEATLSTQPSFHQWWLLQVRKIVALFDPYEAPDNLSIYYLEDVSPFVRWGIPHWMIFIPGVGGCLLGLWKRDFRQLWMWLFVVSLFASLFLTTVLSRYRQAFALLWIPWAAYFISWLWLVIEAKRYRALIMAGLGLLFGWWLCLGPFSIRPRKTYPRALEYQLAATIYAQKGDHARARASLEAWNRHLERAQKP